MLQFLHLIQVTDTVASVPYDEREALGHDIWDMLLSCSWKGLTCSPHNFTHFFNYKHGNCYTFNSGINGSAEISSKSGPLYGLSLELFLEQWEYISDVQQAAGMRVSIHDQGTMPFPENNGISIEPGTEASVGVRSKTYVVSILLHITRQVLITREPDPYGDCIDPSADDLRDNIFTRYFNANYTLEVHLIQKLPLCLLIRISAMACRATEFKVRCSCLKDKMERGWGTLNE
ncbi:Amiloride-sensitive sodium channel subunit gamma-2 [Holothuria leucospilota]|uniref:Amiloride-sensitive sodium channel subunit gamma-2 n=1 Tax=Holothuria leucospilota TaxID=206669 RepID=A0A9Q1BNV0_HOLLE|nr:Amiloride-sensitive sodium channel subunit gamma-2 [Holothuria leucospilota]